MRLNDWGHRLPIFWLLQIAGWSAYGLHRTLLDINFFPRGFIYLSVGFALTSALHPFYRRLWVRSPPFTHLVLAAVLCSLVAGFLYLLIAKFFFVLLGAETYLPKAWSWHLLDAFKNSLAHNKTFVFLSWSALYFGIKYWQDARGQKEQTLQARALAQEAQLEMLRYQLNPHFLFNSLNSTSALIRADPERAERIVNELSEFLRYSLLNTEIHSVPLGNELEAVRNFLTIQKIRFEEKLDIQFDIDPEAEKLHVPCFLIHPLVENAIKYGMDAKRLTLTLKISASIHGAALHIEVSNTGRWYQPKDEHLAAFTDFPNGTGIGLKNVRQRLEHSFPGEHEFDVFEESGWVRAAIEIRFRRV